MSANEDILNEFKLITNILDTELASSILESTNWNLELALQTFLEDNSDTDDVLVPEPINEEAQEEEADVTMSGAPGGSKKDKKPSGAKPKIATLGSLNDADSSSDEEQGQAFYAGGSERSGQQVLGPPRKNPIKDYVSEVFRSAQQSGAVVDENSAAPRTVSSRLYGGTGFRLGQTDDDHVVIPGASSGAGSSTGGERQSELVVLKLWRQGFSINDGDLRPYEDPASKEFMECIMKGEIPQELRKQNMNMIHLDLEDHRHEEFVKPKKRFSAFGGAGQTLGSPVPGTAETAPVETVSADAQKTNEQNAQQSMNVDDSQPTTMLQIRLSDGSRLTGRFNHTHTVSAVRDYISRARPQLAAQEFMLLGSFPPKELTNDEATLKDAGLLNATILHRSKH